MAYSADWGYAAVEPRVRDVVGRAVEVFERDLGCAVEQADPGWENPYEGFWGIVINETDPVGMRRLADERPDDAAPGRRAADRADRPAAHQCRHDAQGGLQQDVALHAQLRPAPTPAVPPFELGIQGPCVIDGREIDPFEWLHFTYPLNLTGQPAATVPAGFTDDGLPIGLQIIGRHLDDPLVLRAAAACETAAPWKDRWPPLLQELGL